MFEWSVVAPITMQILFSQCRQLELHVATVAAIDSDQQTMSIPAPSVAPKVSKSASASHLSKPSTKEWTVDAIQFALLSDSTDDLESLCQLTLSGQLRDFDDLFASTQFYSSLCQSLVHAWQHYDLHHLGLGADDAQLEQQLQQHNAPVTHVDDMEDMDESELTDDSTIGSSQSQEDSVRRLTAVYATIIGVLNTPEFNATIAIASLNGAFMNQLIQRLEPQFRSRSSFLHSQVNSSTAAAISGGMQTTRPSPDSRLSHVPISILASVGVAPAARVQDSPHQCEYSSIQSLLHVMYKVLDSIRKPMRLAIAQFFNRFVRKPQRAQGIVELLAVYAAIVKGFKPITSSTDARLIQERRRFLAQHVLPLHLPHSMANELTPILQLYHEPLVYTLTLFIQYDRSILLQAIDCLLAAFPASTVANSPKEVLLLHELEKVLEFASDADFATVSSRVMARVQVCVTSANARISERALSLWRNDSFLSHTRKNAKTLLPALFASLTGDKHWNKSVNKMRANVLTLFRDTDPILFERCAHDHFRLQTKELSMQACDNLIMQLHPERSKEADELSCTPAAAKQATVPQALPACKYSDFVFGAVLGSGSFSSVRYCKRIVKGQSADTWPEYAAKIIDKAQVERQKYRANVDREIALMQQLLHPHVTRLCCVCENAQAIYLMLEYASNKDLHSHISALGSLSIECARHVAGEILMGLQYLHVSGVVYNDCKPENVCVFKNWHVKLTDFGSSRRIQDIELSDRLEGTRAYMAPEVADRSATVSFASDLYAYACTVYQMLAGRTPPWAQPDDDAAHSTPIETKHERHKSVHFKQAEARFPDDFDPHAADLIDRLTCLDPRQRLGVRPSHSQGGMSVDYTLIEQHPFFAGVDLSSLHLQDAPALSIGSVSVGQVSSQWTRRKNSIMWAPMPVHYDFEQGGKYIMPALIEADIEESDARTSEKKANRFTGFKPPDNFFSLKEDQTAESEEDDDNDEESDDLIKTGHRTMNLLPTEEIDESTASSTTGLGAMARLRHQMRAGGNFGGSNPKGLPQAPTGRPPLQSSMRHSQLPPRHGVSSRGTVSTHAATNASGLPPAHPPASSSAPIRAMPLKLHQPTDTAH